MEFEITFVRRKWEPKTKGKNHKRTAYDTWGIQIQIEYLAIRLLFIYQHNDFWIMEKRQIKRKRKFESYFQIPIFFLASYIKNIFIYAQYFVSKHWTFVHRCSFMNNFNFNWNLIKNQFDCPHYKMRLKKY